MASLEKGIEQAKSGMIAPKSPNLKAAQKLAEELED